MRTILLISCIILSSLSFTQSHNGIVSSGSYFVDSNSTLTRNELLLENFLPLKYAENINIGYNENAAVWCSIRIINKLQNHQEIWLCFDNKHLDSLQLFDNSSTQILGDRTRNKSLYLSSHSFKLDLLPNQEKRLLVRLKKGISFMDFSYQLRYEKELINSTKKNMFFVSFLLGIIFILIIFNSILYSFNKQRIYVLYISNSILTAIYIMITTGMAKFFLFPNFLYFSEMRIYSASLWFINLSMFIAYFLELYKTQQNKYNLLLILNFLNILIIVATVSMLASGNIQYLKIPSILGYLNFIVVILLILWATFVNLKVNKFNSIYVFLAFLPNCVWALSLILKALKIIPKEIHTDWLVIISIYEILLFGYVLTSAYFETFKTNNLLNKDIIHQKEIVISSVMDTQIRERSQIAHFLHDKFGSKLSHIIQLHNLKKYDLAHQNILEITKELRDFSHQILPKALEEGDLISSLQTNIKKLNNENEQLKIELYAYDFPICLENQLAYNIYLIALELISNAIKHAKPSEVILEFYKYADSFVFQFTDNGNGFDTNTTPKGFGIRTIESRVLGMGGNLEMNSKPEEGTIIQIIIPF